MLYKGRYFISGCHRLSSAQKLYALFTRGSALEQSAYHKVRCPISTGPTNMHVTKYFCRRILSLTWPASWIQAASVRAQ